MSQHFGDFRYGLRMLVKSPGFTLVAILTLALGIGANTAIFSILNSVLLRPLPYKESLALVKVWANTDRNPEDRVQTSPPNFRDWRDQNRVFTQMGAYFEWFYNLTGQGEPVRVSAAHVSSNLFPMLGMDPMRGRNFTSDEDKPGGASVAIISHAFWQRLFGGDEKTIGKTVTLDEKVFTIVGVMPAGFQFPSRDIELWLPLALNYNESSRLSLFLDVVARLNPGVTIHQAQEEMNVISKRLQNRYPDTNKGWGIKLVPLHEEIVGETRPMLLLLMVSVGLLLLIASANVANLMIARALARQREMAIRSVLGASRARIIQQLLLESLILSFLGGASGLLLANWGIALMKAFGREIIPRLADVQIDVGVLVFTIAISSLTAVLFGLAPAVFVSRTDMNVQLKEGGRGMTESRMRLRSLLVTGEIALALILLIGGALLSKSMIRLLRVNPGFESKNVLVMDVSLPDAKYKNSQQVSQFFDSAIHRIAGIPGVRSAGAISFLPFSGANNMRLFYIEGRPFRGQEDYTGAGYRVISPGYFQTLRIPITAGRDFNYHDRSDSPGVIIINQAHARRFFPGEDPLGKRIKMGRGPDSRRPWLTVVGVAGDIRHSSLDQEAEPEMYLPFLQSPLTIMTFVVKTSSSPESIVNLVSAEIRNLDKNQAVANVKTLKQLISDSVSVRRFDTILLGLFSGIALILSIIGLYGLVSYSVAQRTQEIGIRMVLGARASDILRTVLSQGIRLSLAGILIGIAFALALTRFMISLLYDVSSTDPVTFLAVSIALMVVTLVATYLPARKAIRVHPTRALRYE